MKHLSTDLAGARLGQRITSDAALRDQVLARLGLDPAPVREVPFDPLIDSDGSGLPVVPMLAGDEGSGTVIHFVIGEAGLSRGDGLRNLRRAVFLQELKAPVPHAQTRVVLVTDSARVAAQWESAREFPHWLSVPDPGMSAPLEGCAAL